MTPSITLSSGLTKNRGGFVRRLRETLKLQLRARWQHRQTRDWLHLLNSHPVFHDLVQACPHLIHKVYRDYLSKKLSCRQRVDLLAEHYYFILQQGWGNLMAQAARDPVCLGTVPGKSGSLYHLQLCSVYPMEREGEIVLRLIQEDEVLYSVAFTFFGSVQRASIGVSIGCIQGPNSQDSLHRVREATRDLHGLRPKNLMVRLVRQLGYDHGCRQLLLVSNNNHAVHYSAKKKGRLFANYDELWHELGAKPRPDGDFELPCEDLPLPVMEEIASKKRSEMRKRHEITLALINCLRSGLDAHRRPSPMPTPQHVAANDAQHVDEDDYEAAVA